MKFVLSSVSALYVCGVSKIEHKHKAINGRMDITNSLKLKENIAKFSGKATIGSQFAHYVTNGPYTT